MVKSVVYWCDEMVVAVIMVQRERGGLVISADVEVRNRKQEKQNRSGKIGEGAKLN